MLSRDNTILIDSLIFVGTLLKRAEVTLDIPELVLVTEAVIRDITVTNEDDAPASWIMLLRCLERNKLPVPTVTNIIYTLEETQSELIELLDGVTLF